MKNLTFIFAVFTLLFASPVMADHPKGTSFVDVNGLVCDFCARALEKVFSKQELVESITVDLDTKVITIHYAGEEHLSDEDITALITDSGYNVVDIRHGGLDGE